MVLSLEDKDIIGKDKVPIGENIFWLEEIWLFSAYSKLKSNYPQARWDGLLNINFLNKIPFLLKKYNQNFLSDIKTYEEIPEKPYTTTFFRDRINLAASHAPSQIIAQNYLQKYKKSFRIINIDAHLDLTQSNTFLSNTWITPPLYRKTSIIGGWAELPEDIKGSIKYLPFLGSVEDFLGSKSVSRWLSSASVYITLDFDFFSNNLIDKRLFGISNYWNRDAFIGHSTFNQIIATILSPDEYDSPFYAYEKLSQVYLQKKSYSFDSYIKDRLISIETTLKKVISLITAIINLCNENGANILAIDFVEYSPGCDWQFLSLKRFLKAITEIYPLLY